MIAENRLKEIKDLGDKHNRLVKSSDALKQSLETLSTDMILTNPKYIEAKQTAEFYQKGYNEYFNLSERFRIENVSLRREIEEQRLAFEERFNQKIEEFLKVQKEKDLKLLQMKKERDSIAFQLEEKLEQPSADDLIKELRILTSSQAAHIKRLRSKVDNPDSMDNGKIENSNSQDAGDPGSRIRDFESLVAEMEKKEKKWLIKRDEMQVLIDTYKTASKDSRDLVEIRMSERKLQVENDDLSKRAKSLEEELAAVKQGDGEVRGPNSASQLENDFKKLEKTNKELTKAKESLLSEIDEISKAFEETQEQNDRLLQQVEEKHDTSSRLVKEKLRGRKIQQRMSEESALLQEKLARLSEKIDALTALVRASHLKSKSQQEMVNRLQDELRATQLSLETQKKTSREESLKQQELLERHQSLQTTHDETKKEITALKLQVEEKEQTVTRLSEEKDSLQRKLDRATKSLALSKSSTVNDLAEEELRRQLQCDVCKDRRKSCIVSKCWHIFCRECIENSLTARRRLCPACARSISRSEVHDIFL